jgi:hypothetical protein
MEWGRSMSKTGGLKLTIIGLGALLYNNWLLGNWLNPNLFKNNGSVSEFSVHSQPHALVFRSLDIISGLLIVIIARMFANQLWRSKHEKIILLATTILGLANIMDALRALPCSETLSNKCVIPVSISLSHYQVPAHGYSSTAIALCYFLLPLMGLIYALKRRLWFISTISFLAVADALASFVSALINYIHSRSLSVYTSGAGQEVEMIILAIWLAAFYVSVVRDKARPQTAGKE